MSIHLICTTAAETAASAGDAAEAGLQFLPARVGGQTDADAAVDHYFDQYSGADDRTAPTLANSLRGYPVRGDLFAMPDTHFGCVFEEDKRPLDECGERTMRQRCRFSQFRLWNYDQRPSRNDGLKMAVEGFCLTEELHKRVDPIELELFLLSEHDTAKGNKARAASSSSSSGIGSLKSPADSLKSPAV